MGCDHRDYFGPGRPVTESFTAFVANPGDPRHRRSMAGIYLRPGYSDGLLVIPSRHHASHDKRSWPGNRETVQEHHKPDALDVPDHGDHGGQDVQGRETGQESDQNTGLFASASWPTFLTGRIADPLPLLGIHLRLGWMVAVHDRRPFPIWSRFVVLVGVFIL